MAQPELVNSWAITSPIKGTAEIYSIDDWSFELIRDENGKIYTDELHSEGSIDEAEKAAKAWMAWAEYLEDRLESN